MVDAGGVAVEILGSNSGKAATPMDLENWTKGHGLTITAMMDDQGKDLQVKKELGPHHHYWVIDLATMVILSDGSTPPVTGIQQAVDRLTQ